MEEVVRIPVSARGFDAPGLIEGLGDDVSVERAGAGGRSLDMDPATATLVVGLATAVPKLISAIAAAWSKFRKPSPEPASLLIEMTGGDLVIRVGKDGTVAEADAAALPASAGQILQIHLR